MRAMPKLAVFYFSFISCFAGVLLRHFLNDFDVVPVAPFLLVSLSLSYNNNNNNNVIIISSCVFCLNLPNSRHAYSMNL